MAYIYIHTFLTFYLTFFLAYPLTFYLIFFLANSLWHIFWHSFRHSTWYIFGNSLWLMSGGITLILVFLLGAAGTTAIYSARSLGPAGTSLSQGLLLRRRGPLQSSVCSVDSAGTTLILGLLFGPDRVQCDQALAVAIWRRWRSRRRRRRREARQLTSNLTTLTWQVGT